MDYLTPIHEQIISVLNQTGVVVIVDDHKVCRSNKVDGYTMTYKDKDNDLKKTVLLICEKTVKTNYVDWITELNRTVAHEAIHIAQTCKSNDGYMQRLGFRKDLETEAFAVQDNPKEVLRILKKYCL